MRNNTLSLLCGFLFFVPAAIASSLLSAQTFVSRPAFSDGENLRFNLYFSWKFIWVKAGEAEMFVEDTLLFNTKMHKMTLLCSTNKFADPLFRMRDTLVTVLFEDMRPHYYRKAADEETGTFAVRSGCELPSIPLNPRDEDDSCDVRERGRLKFSADSLDFFSEEGDAGISASNRIKGVVLHEVLSRVRKASDLEDALRQSVLKGDVILSEAGPVYELLSERLGAAVKRGWFSEDAERTLNEAALIDTDGQTYRPDRVEIADGRVAIIDFKFGEHHLKYERQLRKYADIWHRMGYSEVSAYLWYVQDDKVIEVL